MTPAAPSRWTQATVEAVTPRTARILSLFLRADLPAHVAGQHLDVRLTAPDGYQARRSYSIVSAPGAALIELAIERLDDGEVSPFFHDVMQPGDSIEIRGPIGGHFVWRESDGGPLLLIAGGSGIAPLLAMLRQRAVHAPAVPALLIYSARSWDDLVFREELLQAEAKQHGFTLMLVTTRAAKQRPGDADRRLDAALLHEMLARWAQTPARVYVCGANGFVEAVTAALLAEQIPASAIRTERYGGA